MSHLVVVFDRTSGEASLYRDGVMEGSTVVEGLALIEDVNNWLGRSQYDDDPPFAGVYHEFRIYRAALTAPQIAASHEAGPDVALPTN
jgi:hypothetical protein